MAPVIGCRRRPMLGPTRTSYKFRDEGNTHILFTRFARSSIFEAVDREDKTGHGRVEDDSRRSGHMRHTNHRTDAADPWMRPWLVDYLKSSGSAKNVAQMRKGDSKVRSRCVLKWAAGLTVPNT